MINLAGKTAIVTGGASGIGRETALKLARWGAVVFSGDIDADGNATTVELSKTLDGNIVAINLDITNEDSISSLGKMISNSQELGEKGVDIIVNVAGWDKIQPFLDATPDFMNKVLDINLKGPINAIRYFLPEMVKRNSGKIINISSDAGR